MTSVSSLEKRIAKVQFTYSARKEYYNQLISLLDAGVSRVDALEMMWSIASLEGKKPKEGLPIVIADVLKSIRSGETFGNAMRPWIPQDEMTALEAIEGSSDFSGNLREFLFLSEKQKAIKGKIIGGLGYPIFLLSIVAGVIYYFGVTVVPVLSEVLPPERWRGPSYILYLLSIFATTYLQWVILAIILIIPVIIFSLPRWKGAGRKLADKLPFYSTYRMYTGISFLTSVAALSRSGVSISNALGIIKRNASPYVKARVDKILWHMLDGENFGSAMYRAGTGWPDNGMALNVKIFAETQDLSEHMSRMSKEWLIESERKVEANMAVLKYAGMILMFVTIMTIVGGIYGINIQISSGAM